MLRRRTALAVLSACMRRLTKMMRMLLMMMLMMGQLWFSCVDDVGHGDDADADEKNYDDDKNRVAV